LFEAPKVLMRRTDWRLRAALDSSDAICVNSCHVIKLREERGLLSHKLLVSLLNSRLLQRVFEIQNPQMVGKVFAEVKVIYVERLPLPALDDNAARTVEELLALQDHYLELLATCDFGTPSQRTARQRLLAATDGAHENLVRQLYGPGLQG